jgi:hypothetical protein
MRMFKILGNWARGLYLIGFGGFWLGLAYYLSGVGSMFGGAGTTPTVVGLTIFGTLFLACGIVIFVRGLLFAAQRAPLPKEAAGWRDDGERLASDTGFDPDEAIARYLQRRPEGAPVQAPAAAPEMPARPTFGRKQV